ALERRHLPAAPREDEGRAGAEGRRENVRGAAPDARRDERPGREREQLAVARGDRGAEEPDPERQMLNDWTGRGNAAPERAAEDDFAEREEHHHRQRKRGDRVFDRGGDAAAACDGPSKLGPYRRGHFF